MKLEIRKANDTASTLHVEEKLKFLWRGSERLEAMSILTDDHSMRTGLQITFPYDISYRRNRAERQSPKSISSNRKPNLNLSFEAARPRRIEPPMEYRRGEDYGMRRDNSREIYRGEYGDRREASRGGHSRYEASYQYESHGGGGGRGCLLYLSYITLQVVTLQEE